MIANVGVWSVIAGIITALCLVVAAVLFMLYRQDRLNDDVEGILRRIDAEPVDVEDPPAPIALPPADDMEIRPATFQPWQEPSHVAAERVRQGIPADAPISINMQTGAVKRITEEEAQHAREQWSALSDYRNRIKKGGLF